MFYVSYSDAAPADSRAVASGKAGAPQTLANGNRKATGTIAVGTNPANNDTLTVNGVVITFKTSGATGNQIDIGGTAALTAAAIESFLTASTNPLLTVATYSVDTTTVTVTYKTVGAGGNAFTLATSVPAKITVAATLTTGASCPDISLKTRTTIISTTTGGNMDFTLPDGTLEDQEKIIYFKTKTSSSSAVINGTLATYSSGESTATKVTLGASTAYVVLRWLNGKWRNMYNAGATYS